MKTNPDQKPCKFPVIFIHTDDLHYKWDDVDLGNPYDGSELEGKLIDGTAPERALKILESIPKVGLINPLIVDYKKGMFFVNLGNQRLACLRVLNYGQPVPCRIVAEGTNECVVLVEHPNKPIPEDVK